MAEEQSGQEKTEEPTEKRLKEGREKGDVAKSTEVPSALILILALLVLYLMRGYFYTKLLDVFRLYLPHLHTIEITSENMIAQLRQGITLMALILGPLMAIVLVAGLAGNFGQIGFLFTTEKMVPKYEKIDPIKGLGRLFSIQTLATGLKSISKIIIVGLVAYLEISKYLPETLPLMDKEVFPIFAFYTKVSFWIFLKSAIIIAVLAAADYAFQRWQFQEKMKMTKQEVDEEAKSTEGDPQVKGKIRSIQQEMARKRMMAEVPEADVVITNPTRLAVALRYDSETMTSPTVTAKGSGLIAKRIKDIARENDIPLMEDKPLAQALYKEVEIDSQIPENLFQAVAEILAYVYNLKQKRA
ncbi:MAG: flagellar biosynthesis protein FlhB [Desulfurivibrionaceae bacterium]